MGFNFPNSPTVNQIFTPIGGPTYTWDGTVWKMTGTSGVLTADSMNRIVNGAMQISQENGNTAGSTDGYYPVDQWVSRLSGLTGVTFYRSPTLSPTAPSGIAAGHSTNLSVAKPSLAAGDYVFINQAVEGNRIANFGWGTSDARSVVLRFDCYANVAGTYSVAIRNTGGVRSWTAGFVQPTDWKTHTVVIPGDTTGTWATDSTIGALISFGWAIGSTFTAPTAGWNAGNYQGAPGASNGASTGTLIAIVTNVGLYLDPNATGVAPPWQMPDYAEELRTCQRYWQQYGGQVNTPIAAGVAVTSTSFQGYLAFICPMRVSPAFTAAPAAMTIRYSSTAIPTSLSGSNMMTHAAYIVADATGMTVGQGAVLRMTDTSIGLKLNARM